MLFAIIKNRIIMVVKSSDSKHREFKGIKFELLSTGDKTMVTKMIYNIGDKIPIHSHPNEQSGYVISGEYLIKIGEIKETLKQGDSYSIPKNVEHSLEVIIGGNIIDVFSPPRKDYM